MKYRYLIILVFLAGLHTACRGQSVLQKQVQLPLHSGTVKEMLTALGRIEGVTLSYSSGLISMAKQVQLTGEERTVEDHLRSILKNQPLTFLEKEGKILIVYDPRSPHKRKATISGYISDKKSGERLIGASVFVPASRLGTTSNKYGFFSLTLDADTVSLLVSHAGYLPGFASLSLTEDTVLQLTLEQNVVVNEIAVVNAESKTMAQNRTLTGRVNMPARMVKSLPALLGEADVMKALQLLPGIQAGNEGSSGLVVRGGSADQNLILLDGVPVYNASHAFGLFSIFNADAVHHVEVMKSGFPASYGGRLSSVVDVQMKEGDKYKFHGEGGLGLIFSKLTLEGPISKGRSSFLISGRRTYLDLILRPILKATEGSGFDLKTVMSDLNLKTNFKLGEKDHFYLSLYTGIDKYGTAYRLSYMDPFTHEELTSDTKYGFAWGNNTAMARWNHVYNKKLFGNLSFNYSHFRFRMYGDAKAREKNSGNTTNIRQRYLSAVRDYSLRFDMDYLPSPRHFVKLGLSAILHHYQPGESSHFQEDTAVRLNLRITNKAISAGEFDLYAEDDIRLTGRMKMNAGVRFSGFTADGQFYFSVQPRLNWLCQLNNRWSVKASAIRMNQYIHLLTNSNLGLPTDLWLPVTGRVPPQNASQVSAGVTFSQPRLLEASAEIYYKRLNNVIEYKEGAGFTNSFSNWEDMVESGRGDAYGAEWLVQRKKGKLTGLLSYTLSWSNRRFANINDGQKFPYKFDKRHEIKAALFWQVSKSFEMSASWQYSTGNAISMPKGQYFDPVSNFYIDIYEGRNDYRLPAYHRMDLSMKWMKQRPKFLRTWALSIYNVYNQPNTFFIYKDANYYTRRVIFRKVTLFPIIPSIAYQFKF